MTIDQQYYIAGRRARVLGFITQFPPMPVRDIAAKEGVAERTLRRIIKELEREHHITYQGWGLRYTASLSDDTRAMRASLADWLYRVHGQVGDRREVAALVGLNCREQIRAVNRPFNHDWTLSQIERLAQAAGRSVAELGLHST